MKKSSGSGSGSRTRRCLTANFLETRLQFPVASSPANQPSPKSPIFNTSSRRKRAADAAGGGASASVTAALMESPKSNALASIPDLKHLASSRLRDLKLHVDRSHSEILKDFDSSQSRLHKRFKIQSQACQQVLDEADKEYKKMTQRITESREAMAASYAEFMADAQTTASRACKTSIAELSQSFEKQIDALRRRYGIQTN
ncbi:hypothetical protein D8674_028336 [Pyrus ussuriensis x Pyrus communis]|uniref:Uncharacterized protein n=1 Tax=Pyrus ussuriensis x Pyrus communis TaxID=2448454 RepID=A0A5N5HWU2_9ROSA|nr:hypothetical protein D8674_028336 [Pyrus ussuriensis x Pyrus communis]